MTSRFEKGLTKQSDQLLESFFTDDKIETKREKQENKANFFEEKCKEHLRQFLVQVQEGNNPKRAEKSAASVLKVMHKLVVDFHMRRIRHPKRLTLLCWEWDHQHERYKTGGDMSKWEIEVCRGVGHVKQYCAEKFAFNPESIHILYQGRHLTDEERFRDVCVTKGSFINMIFLRDEDTLESINLDVAEMEHGTPQEAIERSEGWIPLLEQFLITDTVGPRVASLSWDLLRTLPRRTCYQRLLMRFSDEGQIAGGDVRLPKEIAGLIGSFVPSTIQDIYLQLAAEGEMDGSLVEGS